MEKITLRSKKQAFDEMLKNHRFIGFINTGRFIVEKHIIIRGGPLRGLAINHDNIWVEADKQPEAKGTYYAFGSKNALYIWMSGNDNVKGAEIVIDDYQTLQDLKSKHRYVGFICDHTKYILVQNGCCEFAGVSSDGMTTSLPTQDYYAFDSRSELYEWMKG